MYRPRFSIAFIFVLVTLACVGFGSRRTYLLRQNRLQACIDHSDLYLLSMHQALNPGTTTSPQLTPVPGKKTGTSVILPDGRYRDGKVASKSEQDLVASFGATAPNRGLDDYETNGDLSGHSFVFYRAVRAKASCVVCHNSGNAGIQKGDLVGVVRVAVGR